MTVFVGCPEGCRYNTASAVYDLVIISFNHFGFSPLLPTFLHVIALGYKNTPVRRRRRKKELGLSCAGYIIDLLNKN